MKKSLVALAALAVIGAASAQSSVTLSGVVDAALAYGSGDLTNKTRLVNSAYRSSHLLFSGTEDLGGGLKASFHLEAGINNDDGSGQTTNLNNQTTVGQANGGGGMTFNRRSTVSIQGGFGEVRLGRDYTPHYLNHSAYDPFGQLGVGASRAVVGSTTAFGGINFTAVRASNSVAYHSPTFSGFGVRVQAYLGENADNLPNAGSGSSIRGTYAMGPVSLGLAYGKTTTGAGTDLKSTNLGGSYDFGVAKLMGAITKDAATGFDDVKGWQLGAHIPMGSGLVRTSLSQTDNGTATQKQFALGYVYNLSKRTDLYATVATVRNSGGASAALNGSTTSANGSSNGYDVGVKHAF
ncbi:MAG: porin [Sulfuricaulis sp.]|nr:porin [Sulfuricaulis sp.]